MTLSIRVYEKVRESAWSLAQAALDERGTPYTVKDAKKLSEQIEESLQGTLTEFNRKGTTSDR